MTTNNSGKLNMGGVAAIKEITRIPPSQRTPRQSAYLALVWRPLLISLAAGTSIKIGGQVALSGFWQKGG